MRDVEQPFNNTRRKSLWAAVKEVMTMLAAAVLFAGCFYFLLIAVFLFGG